MGGEERSDGIGIFVAEKWVDSVVSVERHSKRILILRMVLDNGLLNVLTVYAPHSGKWEEEKVSFWNYVFHLEGCIPQNEMVVLARDMDMLEVVTLAMMGHMVVLCMKIGMQMDPGS